MNEKFYFFLDTETGGLTKEVSLLTLDGTLTDMDLNVVDTISLKIKPDDGLYKVYARALEVNKINLAEHNSGAIPMSQAQKQFESWASKWSGTKCDTNMTFCSPTVEIYPVGQNVTFDIDFIKLDLLPNWGSYFSRRIIDLQCIALFLKQADYIPKQQRVSLTEMTKYFNIPIEEEKMHNSAVDVAASIEIFRNYLRLVKRTTGNT